VGRRLQDADRKPGHLLIDGEWVEAASRKTFETLDPATEGSLGRWSTAPPRTSSAPWLRRVGAVTTSARTGVG
jgi:hypothetical protein